MSSANEKPVDQFKRRVYTGTHPAAEQVRKWLLGEMKIEVSDGRVIQGVFECLDKQENILLSNCVEYKNSADTNGRLVGMVCVPKEELVSVKVKSTRRIVKSVTILS